MTTTLPYKPLNDFVLVLADKALDSTANGIILTAALKTGTKTGTVVAVGPGRFNEKTGRLDKMSVSVGQRVTFGEFVGRSDLPVDPEYPRGQHYKVIANGDILAVIEPNEDDVNGRILEAFRVLGLTNEVKVTLHSLPGDAASFIVAEALGQLMIDYLTEALRYNLPEPEARSPGITHTHANG